MSENEKHNEKMKRLKTSKQKIFAKKTVKKGLIIVHTGTGKGKSTAAFGMVFRGIAVSYTHLTLPTNREV
mgnify:CR=1 FL=1